MLTSANLCNVDSGGTDTARAAHQFLIADGASLSRPVRSGTLSYLSIAWPRTKRTVSLDELGDMGELMRGRLIIKPDTYASSVVFHGRRRPLCQCSDESAPSRKWPLIVRFYCQAIRHARDPKIENSLSSAELP